MRTKWIALTAATFLVPPVAAQAQQPFNWSGFYVGLNAGGSWARSAAITSMPCNPNNDYFSCAGVPLTNAPAVANAGTGSASGSGFTGGLQAGYNWQSSQFVYGVEADFGAFSFNAKRQVSAHYPANLGYLTTANVLTFASLADTDWLLTARGRIGATFGSLLVYGTGGLALTNFNITHSFRDDESNGPAAGTWKTASTRMGWTIGGGLELALNNKWTVKAEYLYMDFGSMTTPGIINSPAPAGPYVQAISTSVDLTAQTARLGINYRF